MSKPSALSKVIADLEAERADLLARVAVMDQLIAKLLVSSQAAKKTRKPRLVKQDGGAA